MKYFFFLAEGQALLVDSIDLGSLLLKIMFPYLLFISCAAILQGLLNSHGGFSIPAATPIILNAVIIIIAFSTLISGLSSERIAIAIALAVTLGGALQLGFLVPFVYKLGASLKPTLIGMESQTKRFFSLLGPIIFSSSIYQINQIIVDPIVVHLGAGSVSVLQYSLRLQELPIGIIIVSLTTVTLPSLSNMTGAEDMYDFQKKINQLLRFLLLILAVIIPVGIFAREDIVYLLFRSGHFGLEAVALTATCLLFHLLALFPIGCHRMLNNVFFAMQDTKTPFLVSVYSLPVNVIFAYTLSTTFEMGPPGIALATALSTLFSVLLLYSYMEKKLSLKITTDSYLFCFKVLIITLMLNLFIYAYPQVGSLSSLFLPLAPDSLLISKLAKGINFLGLTCVYGFLFCLLAYWFKVRELFLLFSFRKKGLERK